MMRRISSFLFMLILSISVMGCGNASASSENANSNNDSTPATENSPALSQGVSNTAVNDGTVSSETTIETTEVVSEPEPVQNFTGSLYTLPVGAKGEEWTEEQLDEYLKDCKVYQKYCQPSENGKIKFSIDDLVIDFGFEYVDTLEQKPYIPYNVYWRQKDGLKFIIQYDAADHFDIYIDSGDDSVCVKMGNFYSRDNSVILLSDHFSERPQKVSQLYLKSICATMFAITRSKEFDCSRLPFPDSYSLRYADGRSFNLQKRLDFYNADFEAELKEVYSE